jgi:hypothetical protein
LIGAASLHHAHQRADHQFKSLLGTLASLQGLGWLITGGRSGGHRFGERRNYLVKEKPLAAAGKTLLNTLTDCTIAIPIR